MDASALFQGGESSLGLHCLPTLWLVDIPGQDPFHVPGWKLPTSLSVCGLYRLLLLMPEMEVSTWRQREAVKFDGVDTDR